MEVILLEDVKKLGKKGDLVEVSDGYGVNFLIKKNKAKEATNAAKKELAAKKQAKARQEQEELDAAKKDKEKLENSTVTIKEKASEDGRLFGQVTTKQIAEGIEEQLDIKVDKRKIETKVEMRAVGSQTVSVKLHNDVIAELEVDVLAK